MDVHFKDLEWIVMPRQPKRNKIETQSLKDALNPFQLECFYRYTASAQNLLHGSTEVKREYLLGFKLTPLSRMKMGNIQIIFTRLAAKSKFLR